MTPKSMLKPRYHFLTRRHNHGGSEVLYYSSVTPKFEPNLEYCYAVIQK